MNSLTIEQIALIKRTWRLLRHIDPALLGEVFYEYLFIQNPNLRRLFTGPMDAQYQKFVAMLNAIVVGIEQPATMLANVQTLGQRHATYGVRPSHYDAVGDALLWTLERGLGKDWTTEAKTAWHCCYQALTQLMLSATKADA
ncbi:globin family protein [Spirosoma knui]